MARATKILLFFLFSISVSTTAYLAFRYYKETRIPQENLELNLTGTIKKGKDISPQKDYCPNELYIVTKDKTYQLRTPDKRNEKASIVYAKYRDLEVSLKAKFNDILPNNDPRKKNCASDQFILVENSNNKTTSVFNSYSGKISCLPLLNGEQVNSSDCALGLATNDGKYYILEDIADDFITQGKEINLTGDLSNEKTISNYKIDGVISVIEVK